MVDWHVSEACGSPLRSVDELHVFPSHSVHGVSGDCGGTDLGPVTV